MNKIYCFGDGFAAGHIWPEWPNILSALYPDVENYGAIGAGNEYMTSAIVRAHTHDPKAFFVVQWAQHNRFDKLIEDASWDNVISEDPVYDFNVVELDNQRWWLSSASSTEQIQTYHRQYVQPQQSLLRTHNYKYLVEHLLAEQSIFFSTQDMEQYSRQPRFSQSRQSEIQPSPWVHFCYVREILLPKMPVQPNTARLQQLEQRIQDHKWAAYDPDRDQIWQDLINF